MDLQDLVTSHVEVAPQETKKTFSPLEALEKGYGSFNKEALELCKAFPTELKENPSRAPYLVAQIDCYMQNTNRSLTRRYAHGRAIKLIAHAIEYAENGAQESLEALLEWSQYIIDQFAKGEEEHLLRIAIGNRELQIEFLQDVFKDTLADELSYITGVKKASAKRWIHGGGTTWRNSRKIENLARIFYALESQQGLSRKEALEWYRSGGTKDGSARERLSESLGYSNDLERLMEAIGASSC